MLLIYHDSLCLLYVLGHKKQHRLDYASYVVRFIGEFEGIGIFRKFLFSLIFAVNTWFNNQ